MDSFAALLALAALATGGITVLLAVVLALATAPRRPAAVLLALTGAVLTAVWVELSYQGGVHADETGTSGNILDDVAWLIAAVVLSVTSLVLGARHRRHHSPLTPLP
ncbi:hypothetical protein FHR75_004173 [Kineococcus radiotolerans]|uniref:Uncharacterized protein n=1 Tax=Kineococcus radiotolerans TaxID=131568 RepID=A0A7W4XYM7_KINRA|nr:hypothetical protein [Kineococcus radiotolerans]MBB2903331.1 hypothetical protein [Kineococcus radiotolerans]